MENRPIMLKIKEVPERFPGLTEHAIRQLALTGEIASTRIGKKILIAEENIAYFLRMGNNTAANTEPPRIRRIDR